MSRQNDIRIVVEQEQALVLSQFDEAIAFRLGALLREKALNSGLGIVADVRTWGRPLFYMALPGTTGDNPHWVRRKYNVVHRMMKSSYRVVLEKSWPEDVFPPRRALDAADFALAGGSFPIQVSGAGVIGAITVSGLHERDDHGMVVEALCRHLGMDTTALMLPPLEA